MNQETILEIKLSLIMKGDQTGLKNKEIKKFIRSRYGAKIKNISIKGSELIDLNSEENIALQRLDACKRIIKTIVRDMSEAKNFRYTIGGLAGYKNCKGIVFLKLLKTNTKINFKFKENTIEVNVPYIKSKMSSHLIAKTILDICNPKFIDDTKTLITKYI